eukprot:363440-Chlamydomonas_euryale.AAC.3
MNGHGDSASLGMRCATSLTYDCKRAKQRDRGKVWARVWIKEGVWMGCDVQPTSTCTSLKAAHAHH